MNPTDTKARELARAVVAEFYLSRDKGYPDCAPMFLDDDEAIEKLMAVLSGTDGKPESEGNPALQRIRAVSDALDLNNDEFARIKAAPGCTAEIASLCDRAQQRTTRTVPLIEECSNALKEVIRLRARITAKAGALLEAGELLREVILGRSSDPRFHCPFNHVSQQRFAMDKWDAARQGAEVITIPAAKDAIAGVISRMPEQDAFTALLADNSWSDREKGIARTAWKASRDFFTKPPIPAAKVEEIARKGTNGVLEWSGEYLNEDKVHKVIHSAITEALASVQQKEEELKRDVARLRLRNEIFEAAYNRAYKGTHQSHNGHWDREGTHGANCPECIRANEAREDCQNIIATGLEKLAALASVQGGETEEKCS